MSNYLAKFKLSNYINSRVVEIENDDGVMEKGIFIPIEINGLTLTPRNQVISWMFVNEKLHETCDGYSHYIKMKTNHKHVEELDRMGYSVPYVGSMKSSEYVTQYHKKMYNYNSTRVKNISNDE
jgi:hypothetical protein